MTAVWTKKGTNVSGSSGNRRQGRTTSAIKRVKEDQGLDIATQKTSRQRQQDFPFSTPSLPFAHNNSNSSREPVHNDFIISKHFEAKMTMQQSARRAIGRAALKKYRNWSETDEG
jgi:hypothetical protein